MIVHHLHYHEKSTGKHVRQSFDRPIYQLSSLQLEQAYFSLSHAYFIADGVNYKEMQWKIWCNEKSDEKSLGGHNTPAWNCRNVTTNGMWHQQSTLQLFTATYAETLMGLVIDTWAHHTSIGYKQGHSRGSQVPDMYTITTPALNSYLLHLWHSEGLMATTLPHRIFQATLTSAYSHVPTRSKRCYLDKFENNKWSFNSQPSTCL